MTNLLCIFLVKTSTCSAVLFFFFAVNIFFLKDFNILNWSEFALFYLKKVI